MYAIRSYYEDHPVERLGEESRLPPRRGRDREVIRAVQRGIGLEVRGVRDLGAVRAPARSRVGTGIGRDLQQLGAARNNFV